MAINFVLSMTDKVSGPAKTMTGSIMAVADGANKVEAAMKSLEEHVGAAGEKVGHAGGMFGELKSHISEMLVLDPVEIFDKIGEGAEMAVEGVKKLGEAVLEFANMAIEASEAKEKLVASFSALAGGAAAGESTLSLIRDLEKEVPQNQATLGQWSNQLLGAGVALGDLQGSLKAVAGAEALVGGGDKVLGLISKLNEAGQKGSKLKFSTTMLAGTGVTEEELTKKLGMTPKQLELAKKQGTLTGKQLSDALVSVLSEKGAGPIEAQTKGLAAQWDKLKDNVMRLFEDVDVGPFLDAVKSLFSVFDQGTNSGKAMKSGITSALNAIFKWVAQIIPKVRTLFLELMVYALKGYIALKPLVAGFINLWKSTNASAILMIALKGIAWAIGAVVVIVGVVIGAFVAFTAAITAVTGAIIGGLVAALGYIVKWNVKVIEAIYGLVTGANTIAKDFINGLVDGIKNGAGIVIDAVKNLGSKMLGGIKSVLGIHSPSVEMMKLGNMTGSGFAQGITAANDNVSSAAGGLSASATAGITPGGGTTSAASGGGTTVHVDNISIQIDGAKSPQATGEAVLSELATAFESLALTQGLGSAA